jgi:hypothetical protein
MSEWQPIETAPKDGTWVMIKWEMNPGKLDGPVVKCQWIKKYQHHDWYAEQPLGPLGNFYPTHWQYENGKPALLK